MRWVERPAGDFLAGTIRAAVQPFRYRTRVAELLGISAAAAEGVRPGTMVPPNVDHYQDHAAVHLVVEQDQRDATGTVLERTTIADPNNVWPVALESSGAAGDVNAAGDVKSAPLMPVRDRGLAADPPIGPVTENRLTHDRAPRQVWDVSIPDVLERGPGVQRKHGPPVPEPPVPERSISPSNQSVLPLRPLRPLTPPPPTASTDTTVVVQQADPTVGPSPRASSTITPPDLEVNPPTAVSSTNESSNLPVLTGQMTPAATTVPTADPPVGASEETRAARVMVTQAEAIVTQAEAAPTQAHSASKRSDSPVLEPATGHRSTRTAPRRLPFVDEPGDGGIINLEAAAESVVMLPSRSYPVRMVTARSVAPTALGEPTRKAAPTGLTDTGSPRSHPRSQQPAPVPPRTITVTTPAPLSSGYRARLHLGRRGLRGLR